MWPGPQSLFYGDMDDGAHNAGRGLGESQGNGIIADHEEGLATTTFSGLPDTASPGDETIAYLRSLEHVELSVFFASIRSPRVRGEILALLGSLVNEGSESRP